jgi:GT2 family glycosyltransferase
MIEPRPTGSKIVIHADFGQSLETFQEARLLAEYRQLPHHDWSGASFPPFIISRKAWLSVGGFSVEFSPGMYSDPDFSMKLWRIGCRTFQGLSDSRVYHFMARSTGRVKKNNGRIQFMRKWGIPASYFYKYYLKMGEPYQGILSPPTEGVAFWLARLKARVLFNF